MPTVFTLFGGNTLFDTVRKCLKHTMNNESSELQRNLEETMSKLKAARDPETRRKLLRDMRRLLAEADGDSTTSK